MRISIVGEEYIVPDSELEEFSRKSEEFENQCFKNWGSNSNNPNLKSLSFSTFFFDYVNKNWSKYRK